MLQIRKATREDAGALRELYSCHLTSDPPTQGQELGQWEELLQQFEADDNYHILVGVEEGRAISSVTLVVVRNLTHGLRPYALIENVVTHADYRGRHCATALMERAGEIARGMGCYKIMLMTGSKREETLRFYENCGFNRNDKTAFIRWL